MFTSLSLTILPYIHQGIQGSCHGDTVMTDLSSVTEKAHVKTLVRGPP